MLKVYIDRLRDEKSEKIKESLPPDFIDIEDSELAFDHPIHVEGEAYMASDHLVMHLKVTTKAHMPCGICNSMQGFMINLDNFYHTEPLENIREAQYDFGPMLREAILVEVPHYLKCPEGCPNSELVKPYKREEEVYYPFAELDKES